MPAISKREPGEGPQAFIKPVRSKTPAARVEPPEPVPPTLTAAESKPGCSLRRPQHCPPLTRWRVCPWSRAAGWRSPARAAPGRQVPPARRPPWEPRGLARKRPEPLEVPGPGRWEAALVRPAGARLGPWVRARALAGGPLSPLLGGLVLRQIINCQGPGARRSISRWRPGTSKSKRPQEKGRFFFSRLGSGASPLGDTQYAFQVLMVLYLKSANEVNQGYASVLT